MDREFDRSEEVCLRDYPLGKPTNIYGKIVGFLPNDYYNVLLLNGLNEGRITRYKSWSLIGKKDVGRVENGIGVSLEE
jgi:hypothetical protein